MDFNILGSLDVRDSEGQEVRLPVGRERSLLVLLLIHRGDVVSADRIVDALWGEHAPETAAKAVQGYVSRLRRVLEPAEGAGDAQIVTRSPGYVLRSEGISVDAARFERLAGNGRRALEDGSAAEAVVLLDEALALWRGPALADFVFDDFAQHEIQRLEELRLGATEDRIDALLQLGRHGDLVAPLGALVAAHPLRERLRAQSMLALYRNGRQAEALQVYRDGRRLLATELGLEPGSELQRMERAILAQDPALEAAPPVTPPARPREADTVTPPSVQRTRRTRVAVGGALLAFAAAAGVLAVLLLRDEAPASVDVVAPAVVVVDPETNTVVASIRVGSRPASIASGEGSVWVGDARDGTVTRIDPVTRSVAGTVGIGAPAIDLATGAGSIWVATGGFGTIVRIDPELSAVARRIELADPGGSIVPTASSVGVGDGRVWAGAFQGLVRIDPDSGELTGRVDLGDAAAIQIAVGGGAVWATVLERRVKRVEASAARETAEFYAGRFTIALALTRSALWVGGADDGQLWKLDPVTGSTLLTAKAGMGASGIAVSSDAVWVASRDDHTVVRVDPATGDVLATIPIGGRPEDVVVGGGLVWVAVQDAPIAS